MRYLLIVFLILIYVFGGIPMWMSSESTPLLLKAMQYHFFHANVFHLLVNCFAAWSVFNPKRNDNLFVFLMAYAIGVTVYPLSTIPVIGISNILYAAIGMHTPSLKSKWWTSAPAITFFVVTFLMLFFKQFAGATHIASFLLGVCIAIIRRWTKR